MCTGRTLAESTAYLCPLAVHICEQSHQVLSSPEVVQYPMSRSRGSTLLSRVLQRGSGVCSCSYSPSVAESSPALHSSFSTSTARTVPGLPAILTQLRLEAVSQLERSLRWLTMLRGSARNILHYMIMVSCRRAADNLLPSGPCQVKQALAGLLPAAQESSIKPKGQLSARKTLLMRSLINTSHKDLWALSKAPHIRW